ENSSGWSVGRWLFRNCQTTTKAKMSMIQTRNVLCPWRTRSPFGVGGRHGLDLSSTRESDRLRSPPHTTKVLPPKKGASNTGFGTTTIGFGARRRTKHTEPASRRRARARELGGAQTGHEKDLVVDGGQHRQEPAQGTRDLCIN